MRTDIVVIVIIGIISLFTLSVIYMTGTGMVEGHIHPLIESLNENSTVGFSGELYTRAGNRLWSGMKYAFYILIGTIFLYVAVKALYEKEDISVYRGE